MLNAQKTFCDYLNNVKTELGKASFSGLFEELKENIHISESLKQDIAEAELIVPVVGAFSAGKSTLINSFLGAEHLLVGITPETSLATELRYSGSKSIEAVGKDGEGSTVENLEALKEQAAQYQYAKVFLKSEPLRAIQPLVLVDMPGFDSPLDLHHRAILTYLARGSHYAVLISVEEGTVTRSVQRRIAELHGAGKRFSVFLSKANLRSDSEVRDIAADIEERLADNFDLGCSVVPVGLDGGESLAKMLHAIDPEALFDRIWLPHLEAHYFDLDGSLNTRISSLQKDERENQEAIERLVAGLQELQRKKDELIADIRARYSINRLNTIVEGVGRDLHDAVEYLTRLAVSSGEDALQRELSEIVRVSLLSHVKTEMERLKEQIAEDLVSSIKDIGSVLNTYTDESAEQWLEKVTQLVRVGSEAIKGIGKGTKIAKGSLTLYRGITAALAITTSIVMPLLELVIVFFPDILEWFRKGRLEQQVRDQLLGTVIPSVKSKIRSELPKHFEEQVNAMISEQVEVIDEHIKARKDEIAATEQTKKDKIQDIEQTIAELTSIRDNIRTLANQVIFAQ